MDVDVDIFAKNLLSNNFSNSNTTSISSQVKNHSLSLVFFVFSIHFFLLSFSHWLSKHISFSTLVLRVSILSLAKTLRMLPPNDSAFSATKVFGEFPPSFVRFCWIQLCMKFYFHCFYYLSSARLLMCFSSKFKPNSK